MLLIINWWELNRCQKGSKSWWQESLSRNSSLVKTETVSSFPDWLWDRVVDFIINLVKIRFPCEWKINKCFENSAIAPNRGIASALICRSEWAFTRWCLFAIVKPFQVNLGLRVLLDPFKPRSTLWLFKTRLIIVHTCCICCSLFPRL